MRLGSPFDALHEAVASAIHRDLPEVRYWSRDWVAYNALPKEERLKLRAGEGPGEYKTRRPDCHEVEVVMFPQTWGSTALGYGGMGGAAVTPAYTVVVSSHDTYCVYFGFGRLAYKFEGRAMTPAGREQFMKDLHGQNMAHCRDAHKYK